VQKREKIEKVTGSQDDAFWEGTENIWSGAKNREKIEKVTDSRDDKGDRDASMEGGSCTEGVFFILFRWAAGSPQPIPYSG
jgi:hypothetical protein